MVVNTNFIILQNRKQYFNLYKVGVIDTNEKQWSTNRKVTHLKGDNSVGTIGEPQFECGLLL